MNRKGLTLLEVLAVMVILSILASMTFWLLGNVENSRITATDGQVRTLGLEAAMHAKLKGFPPAALEELAPRLDNPGWIKDGKFVDAWEHPIGYRVDGKNFTVWSWGPDGVSGTADDLKFERN
jgi:general secretion pathway protein G